MSKLGIIIKREYLTRVKKKSFLIMTFLTPLLLILIIAVPVIIQSQNKGEHKYFAIVDEGLKMKDAFVSNENIDYLYFSGNIDTAININKSGNYTGAVFIPANYMKDSVVIISDKPVSLLAKSEIKHSIDAYVRLQNLKKLNIDPVEIQKAYVSVPVKTLVNKEGKLKSSSSEIMTGLGFIGAMLIYMFIFMYGVQLMRGTMEEKGGRIVEIIVSSVKSFELMMGKIIGIALVAFTQFGIWILSLLVLIIASKGTLNAHLPEMATILQSLKDINLTSWVILFLIYFIGSYLLYGSLFAAIGAAVDSETDTQQFVLPITIPLLLAFVFAQSIIEDPSGQLAVWLSIIPFTSPIVMMVRIGFGVPAWQLILSIVLLIITFIITVYIAAKIYRIGLLSYGKKVTYKELWKWIRYKG